MSLILIYYISAIVAGVAATIIAGRQILKAMRNRWLDEGAQAKAIQDNAAATMANTAAIEKLSDKFDSFGEKMLDHETRIHWIELTLPPEKRPPNWSTWAQFNKPAGTWTEDER